MGKRSNGEGSVVKRKDGRWCAAYTAGGKRKYLYGKTRKEVVGKLKDTLAESDGAYYPDIEVEDYLTRWLEDSVKESVRASTHERYESVCRVHIVPHIGKTNLADLTEMNVQSLYRERLGSGCSPRTVQYVHVTLHKALKQAVRWRLVPRNVAEAAVPPKVQKKEIVVLSPAQVKVFLKSVEGHRLEAMFVLAVTTGMRQGEMTGLRWEDIDEADGALYVLRTLSKTKEGIVFNQPKTAKGRRSVALTCLAIRALNKHRVRQQAEKGSWKKDHGLVFPNIHGEPRSQREPMIKALKKALEKAGLPQIRFHDLRHTAATLMLSKGVHPKIVSEMLGHGDVAFTLTVYSHVLKGMQKGATQAIDEALRIDD
jgi:integrase